MSHPTEPSAPQTAQPQAPPATPADVQTSADAAALAKAAELAGKRQEANATLVLCVDSYKLGETAMRAGRLDAGRLADLYVRQRLALGDKREAAIQAVEGELSKHASDTVDASGLIRCYHAWRLLDDGPEKAERVPYGHYVNVFSKLVERTAKDTPAEVWILLPGCEKVCRDLFLDCVVNGFNRTVCGERVATLLKAYAAAQAVKTAADAAQARQDADAAKVKTDAARAAQRQAELVERAAQEALTAATEDKKAELTAVLEKANAAKLQAQRDATMAAAAREQAAREAKQAEQRKLAAEKAAQPKDPSVRQPRTPATAPPAAEGNKLPVHNPLATAKHATAKDLAESLVAQLNANPKPHDVLHEFAKQMKWCGADVKPFVTGMHAGGAIDPLIDMATWIMDNVMEEGNAAPAPAKQLAKVG